jgi:hypothetical protein
MPDIPFYLDDRHYKKYKKLTPQTKKGVNEKVREIYYDLIDKYGVDE